MKLTAENVNAIMLDCLYKPDEIPNNQAPDDAIIVSGLMGGFWFNPTRVAKHENDIRSMLADLPDEFSVGGGWSFLNGCITKTGEQWGEQRDVDALVSLGIAVKAAEWLLKDMAYILPGGVPYFIVI